MSMVMMHVWFIRLTGHFGGIAGENMVSPLFVLFGFFCLVRIRGLGIGVWFFGISGLAEPGTLGQPPSQQVGLEIFNVGGLVDSRGFGIGG